MSFDQLKDLAPALGALLGAFSAFGFTKFFLQTFITDTKSCIKELGRNLSHLEKAHEKELTELKAELHFTRKDLIRVEALLHAQSSGLERNIIKFSELSSSIKALWTVLQRIFPDHIPKRLVDE